MREIISKLKRIEIRIRKTIESRTHGKFNSIFKGSGIEYADIRDYQYGDDVRNIDWKVTAKGHGTFIKTFQEEKEQDVVVVLDISSSQEIGFGKKIKYDIVKELCGIFTLSALEQKSNFGLIAYSNQREIFIKPDRGIKHAYYILHKIFYHKRISNLTKLNEMFKYASKVIKRKSVLVIISDFKDDWNAQLLLPLARKHQLAIIQVSDPTEVKIPSMGIIPILDKETNKTIWINSSSKKYKTQLKQKIFACVFLCLSDK